MKALTITLRIFALVILAISLTHVLIGPRWMPDVGIVTASVDSQHRFYTAMFGFFGGALWWATKNLPMRLLIVKVVAVMFLIGGCARLLSVAMVGVPHPFFLLLLGIELIAPVIVLFWCSKLFSSGNQPLNP